MYEQISKAPRRVPRECLLAFLACMTIWFVTCIWSWSFQITWNRSISLRRCSVVVSWSIEKYDKSDVVASAMADTPRLRVTTESPYYPRFLSAFVVVSAQPRTWVCVVPLWPLVVVAYAWARYRSWTSDAVSREGDCAYCSYAKGGALVCPECGRREKRNVPVALSK